MKKKKVLFFIGSQHLYGEEIFETIKHNGKDIASLISSKLNVDVDLIFQGLLTTSDEIFEAIKEVNHDQDVIGMMTWMHTFSPSKMWIRGLKILQKPLLHLHTQYNEEIPWHEIDMDFMNLNQSAHGDREHGHIFEKMGLYRSVVSGYYKHDYVIKDIEDWIRASIGIDTSNHLNVIRFGDNMRNVAVTDGDKVSAEIKLGWSTNTFGIGDLKAYVDKISDEDIEKAYQNYLSKYDIHTKNIDAVKYQVRLELAINNFLVEHDGQAFTTTFEDLHGLKQLPGLASQELMAKGYGFGAEGDWKTSALLHVIYQMGRGTKNRVSFMEDYTYHLPLNKELVLGSHMLEISPLIATTKPKIEVHPLGIGGKEDPARLLFDAYEGDALQVSLIDLGHRYRMIVASCKAVKPLHPMPNLPVAQAMWQLLPNFEIGTKAWILSGGAHHTVMTYDVSLNALRTYAEMLNIEFIHIGQSTTIDGLKKELLLNDKIYG